MSRRVLVSHPIMMGTGVPWGQDPPVCGHIQGIVIAERLLVRAVVLLCVVLWLCRLQVRGISGRLGI